MSQRTVVVGAGVTGLVAAHTLAAAGVEVTVLEASDHTGGQIRTVDFAGHPVDVGAEAIHLAGPHVTQLLDELDLRDRLITSTMTWTWIWTPRGLRRLPTGVGPAGPTRLGPLITSRVLGPVGFARAALEPLVPRQPLDHDVAVGAFLGRRFGRQVTDRLVDPLLGSLHAGDVSRLSLRAATPYLAAAVQGRRSLVLGGRPPATTGGPAFATFPEGLTTLVDTLADDPRLTVRTGTRVESLRGNGSGEHGDSRFELRTSTGEHLGADAVVLAVPADAAATMLATGPAVSGLSSLRTASVVTVVVAYPRAAIEATPAFGATGILVPSTAGRFLKAATFLSRKWSHLVDDDVFLVRLSAGRAGDADVTALGDDELVGRLHADLIEMTGLRAEPSTTHVQRWPRTMAQLEVGHLDRLAAIRAALPDGVALAGAPYEGVGIASCIRSGRSAAGALAAADSTGTDPSQIGATT